MNEISYRDASSGMNKLFIAQILEIISVIFMFITAVLGLTGISAAVVLPNGELEQAAISYLSVGAIITGVIWAVLAIVAFILELVGLNKAGHDHIYFKYAFGLVFVGILLTIGTTVFAAIPLVADLCSTAAEAVNVVIMILVVYGCISLLNEKGNREMVINGYSIVNLMIIVNILSVIARIIPAFLVSYSLDMIFFGFYALLSIISGIMYIVFLKRAAKALA